jgi:hypothetical protein
VYESNPDVCEDEFILYAENMSTKVESLRGVLTQQLGIDVVEDGATKGVILEVGWLFYWFFGIIQYDIVENY